MTITEHRIGPLTVPPMALGTMHFGTKVPEDTALGCLDAAADTGATFWDTANNYAFWAGTGDESEELLGRWFASRGGSARDRIVLATKVGARPLPGYSDLDHVAGLSARAVREQVQASLRRLRVDRIDLLYAHIDDRSTPLSETLDVFAALVAEGLVGEVAASNLTEERLREALSLDVDHSYRALQQRFTFLAPAAGIRTAPQVVLDAATERLAESADVALVGYSPLLSGAYTRADRPLPEGYDTPANHQRLSLLDRYSEDSGLDAGQLVLAWMTQRSQPVLPIVGVSNTDHVESAWSAVTTPVPEATLFALEQQ